MYKVSKENQTKGLQAVSVYETHFIYETQETAWAFNMVIINSTVLDIV